MQHPQQFSQKLRRHTRIRDSEVVAIHQAEQRPPHPVRREPCRRRFSQLRDHRLIVVRRLARESQVGRVLRSQAVQRDEALAPRIGQLGEATVYLPPPGLAHRQRWQVRLRKVAVIARVLLASLTERHPRRVIPAPSLLPHALTALKRLYLAADLILDGALYRAGAVEVLDLHLRAILSLAHGTHGHVSIAAQRALLHVARARLDVAQDLAQLRDILARLHGGSDVRLAHDLEQRHPGAVEIHQAVHLPARRAAVE